MFDSLVHVTTTGKWFTDRFDASQSRLFQELRAANVTQACLVGMPGVCDNEQVMKTCDEAAPDIRLIPVAGVNPSDESQDPGEHMKTLAASGFRGIKLHARLNDYDPLGDNVKRACQAAGSNGLVVFLDTLFRQKNRATMSATDTIDRLTVAAPNTTFVLLHGGGPEIMNVATLVRARPNLMLDISFTIMDFRGSSVDLDLQYLFGRLDRRMCIGSDMPEYTPAEVLQRFNELAPNLSDEKRENILQENLQKLFGE